MLTILTIMVACGYAISIYYTVRMVKDLSPTAYLRNKERLIDGETERIDVLSLNSPVVID